MVAATGRNYNLYCVIKNAHVVAVIVSLLIFSRPY